MTIHKAPLVGMHYRPPAKAILAHLPSGAPLSIVPEPDNPYDSNALKVLVASSAIPATEHQGLGADSEPYGFDLGTILAEETWHLGYIARNEAAILASLLALPDDFPSGYPAKIAFNATGAPLVTLEVPLPC